ncbi:hypothetical protein AB0C29_18100 [Actinoplanes sp. NPDC048791]|uniref:hypothetical protein n=1 Tax=Actinoplanes sp. NPDC048791 TaxID=3154623 RepID=UPI00340270FC
MPTGAQPDRRSRLARALLAAYGGYAMVAVILLPMTAGDGLLVNAAVVVSALGGVASLALSLRFGRPPTRRQVIALHVALVPIQFILSIPSSIVLLGMSISAAVAVAMKPVLPRLKPAPRRFFLALHVGFSVAWLGLSLSMTALSLIGLSADDPALRHHAYRVMHIFDLGVVIPIVLLSLLSGLVVALLTKWGLTRHWWVLSKFVIALSIPLAAGFAQERWITELIERTADPAVQPGGSGVRLVVCMVVYVVLLATATALSVYKPGGMTPWAKRKRAGVAAPAGQ